MNASSPPSPRDGFSPVALPNPARAATPDLHRAGPSSQPFGARPASPSPLALPRLVPRQPPPEIIIGNHRIIYRDADMTIYPAEGKEALCADGRHLIVVLNCHLTSVYDLGPADVPLLSKIISTTQRLLLDRAAPTASASELERGFTAKDVRIGFVHGMPADPAMPYPHLHAQAFLGSFDRKLPGSTLWRRTVVFNPFNWWSVEDLRAEIREESSNCRVKSGYEDRFDSPIDKVPEAGSIEGLPNALDPDAFADSDSVVSNSPTRASSSGSAATLKPPVSRPSIKIKGNTSSGDYAAVRTNSNHGTGRVLVGRQSSTSTTGSNRNSTSTIGSTR
ncbi:hypothetical protein CcaverHIS002_0104170 [Cutaneotrichosporon cavernicola]|uniref:HIT domain-containing protein n=1 Tax=Cutaneotrichosporon cavernicola TaxID=279322 RepID=A0AA48I7M4_9TREE|nr:uncharacterized protein CcaverHIS019_0104100 [Cutaneotrichosporon cavernicola]BEI79888.1 hypothetical protein CcaverHIS002_0104170 [Cutaneotrichosporon cavernicola]BEI87692.1 hypothetical protein CcaverHIS019_0104100 [Cutaneotrichosporon cavernicola]BEI95464.1 hypothetical protein CcaverHIS631_0104130 [Cutaneotrichosporon cavernicola]BEJ03238.1 hypothetical protein CcaverHIS641_0104130 [Cutaneotrichosporon cavernicola]